ncbi:MAG: hypothetical protein GOMPHAMPRED_007322 [Gomphillus americanus]|uniref:Oxysterol-binding protein n=1 Tax=Gomphillus americanus TaxID=1940652 RepID=A0A8H3ET15_9LECA|nr:MAG: hypothetical protein GOMPHAMPRED_007322 [Gomphillus americanus]
MSSTGGRPSPTPSTTESTKSLPSVVTSQANEDSGKLRALLGILKNFIGVTDIAAVRFSLPTQLLEPLPNLEYWNYLDRPETFKYVKGKPCKPYNSVLGEFFRCTWQVKDTCQPILGTARKKSIIDDSSTADKPVTLSYLTEQTSHHPPVSAFWIDCPQKGIFARGYDQLSAKFTGTSIRVGPGNHNLGIFINLKNRGNEEYQLTHPLAHLGGLLRGSLTVTVADTCYVTCPKTGLKTILHYLEEGWLSKAQNRVVGAIYKYNPNADNITKLKDVPERDIVGRIEGCWKEKIFYTPTNDEKPEPVLLIDLDPLIPEAKTIPPEADQLPNESKRFWKDVTQAIVSKQYETGNKLKQDIEKRQRDKAAERKEASREWRPRFFTGAVTPVGRPDLTDDGRRAIDGLGKGDYKLTENEEYGA